MAKPEHLEILKQGVDVWNRWRNSSTSQIFVPGQINSDRYLDLSAVNLSESDLTGINLSRANLMLANLSNANLIDANLCNVNLSGALLSGAILNGADLIGANIRMTDLHSADLSDANLQSADLSDADLSETDLSYANLSFADISNARLYNANLKDTIFTDTKIANTDLYNAKGLESCRHYGPSIIDHRTIIKSGNLTNTFLRGCSLPDELIDFYASLLSRPFKYYSCFISYASEDEAFAQKLYTDLQNSGVRCWSATEESKISDEIRLVFDETIRFKDKLLIVLSENSTNRPWVEFEIEQALEEEARRKESLFFPILLDHEVFNFEASWVENIKQREYGEFSHWEDPVAYKIAFQRLWNNLRTQRMVK